MFKNQVVIISGGMGGIGFATALRFAQLGAKVAIGDVLPTSSSIEKMDLLRSFNEQCTYTQTDIACPVQTEKWIKDTEVSLGLPTLIIVNAAVARLSDFNKVTAEEWVSDIGINVNGAFFLSKFTTDRLKAHGVPGRVVFVGSWAAVHVHKHMPAYSVSKAAVQMLMKCLALELAPFHILVNEVAPGYVDAGLSGRIWKENPGRKEAAAQRVPTNRVIQAEEVAEKIVFLCDPSNTHMVGSTLLMDGGLSLL